MTERKRRIPLWGYIIITVILVVGGIAFLIWHEFIRIPPPPYRKPNFDLIPKEYVLGKSLLLRVKEVVIHRYPKGGTHGHQSMYVQPGYALYEVKFLANTKRWKDREGKIRLWSETIGKNKVFIMSKPGSHYYFPYPTGEHEGEYTYDVYFVSAMEPDGYSPKRPGKQHFQVLIVVPIKDINEISSMEFYFCGSHVPITDEMVVEWSADLRELRIKASAAKVRGEVWRHIPKAKRSRWNDLSKEEQQKLIAEVKRDLYDWETRQNREENQESSGGEAPESSDPLQPEAPE